MLTFEPAYLLSYLIALLILILVLKKDYWYQKFSPVIDSLFFGEVNPYFDDNIAKHIKTVREDTIQKNINTIKNYALDVAGEKTTKKDKK